MTSFSTNERGSCYLNHIRFVFLLVPDDVMFFSLGYKSGDPDQG